MRAVATSMRQRCMAAKFFTGILLDGPDPERVLGQRGEEAMDSVARAAVSKDHSRTTVVLGRKPVS